MAGAHVFQAVQQSELDTLGLVAVRDFLKKRARYLRLAAQNNNKADGVTFTPISVVCSIDPELLENHIDVEKIDADSVDDCINENVMEYLESMQKREMRLLRPSSSKPKCWQSCRLQCRKRILRCSLLASLRLV
jgi:hypothetical protein